MSAIATQTHTPKVTPVHHMRSWLRRGALGALIALIALTATGAIYQTIVTWADQRSYPAPGQLVDVGGYKLHIYCAGAGSPTVILDHVGGGNAAQWALVQPEVAKTNRACAYDRAGFGWSDAGPAPRDAQQSMHELHTLLANAGIGGPYVLVGHSYGANVARLYAAAYPREVAGMVLVDPGRLFDTPGVPPEINAEWKADEQMIQQAGPYLARLGLMRLFAPGNPGDLPAPSGAAFDALGLTTRFWDTISAQNDALAATSAEVLAAPHDYGALPLIVLSPSVPDDAGRQVWTKVNAQLATYSTNGIHRVVADATHMSLALSRAQTQSTIDAIRQVVELARTGTRLAAR